MTRKEQEQQQKREEASKAASQRERQTGPLELPVVVPKGPTISKRRSWPVRRPEKRQKQRPLQPQLQLLLPQKQRQAIPKRRSPSKARGSDTMRTSMHAWTWMLIAKSLQKRS